jgi:hypothetical protein
VKGVDKALGILKFTMALLHPSIASVEETEELENEV